MRKFSEDNRPDQRDGCIDDDGVSDRRNTVDPVTDACLQRHVVDVGRHEGDVAEAYHRYAASDNDEPSQKRSTCIAAAAEKKRDGEGEQDQDSLQAEHRDVAWRPKRKQRVRHERR